MPNTDLTGTTWRLNDNQSLNTNTAFDISFTSGNQNYGLLQVSSDAIHYDNSLAYGETGEYIVVDSSLTLSGNVTNNYRINGGTLDAQGNSITGNIIIENNGILKNTNVIGEVKIYSGYLENCNISGEVYIYNGSSSFKDCFFNNRVNIINAQNVTTSFDNVVINPTTNCGGGLNIVNSIVAAENININLASTSATIYNKFIVKGNSQVTLNNCIVDCANTAATVTNFIVEDSAILTMSGTNTYVNAQNISTNILHNSSNNIIITGGTYNWNPSNYNFITIPYGYEVREIVYQGNTLYQVIKQVN